MKKIQNFVKSPVTLGRLGKYGTQFNKLSLMLTIISLKLEKSPKSCHKQEISETRAKSERKMRKN